MLVERRIARPTVACSKEMTCVTSAHRINTHTPGTIRSSRPSAMATAVTIAPAINRGSTRAVAARASATDTSTPAFD